LVIDGVIREVIEGAMGGIFVPPGNDEALAEATCYLADNPLKAKEMGASARNYVVNHFSRSDQAQAFLKLINIIVRRNGGTGSYRFMGKRVLDLLLTIPAGVILSPILAVLGLLVRRKYGTPVLFEQERPGLDGKGFKLYKFRTMTNASDQLGNLLADEKRLTGLGRFLRSTSLDELPELFNVLKGDMSIVGPRPLLMQYLDRYTPEQARRHEVKPGITGWAQVNGRNALTWEEKFKLDVWYVDHMSLWLDLKIIGLTIWKIIKREGINQPGQATMEEFKGTVSTDS
jgi:sugar transferase EpsL